MRILPSRAEESYVSDRPSIQFSNTLTSVPLGVGLPTAQEIEDELTEYCNVLLGRATPPVDSPYLDLCEIATAYYARGQELDMMIHNEERKRNVVRGHDLYKIRTGSLRSFIEMARKMADLGSRRLTQEQLLASQRYDAGEMS